MVKVTQQMKPKRKLTLNDTEDMKMKKRIISIILSIVSIISLFPTIAYADGENGWGWGKNAGAYGEGGKWNGEWQGYRISIVNEAGKIMGTPVDILWSEAPTAIAMWTVKTEAFGSRTTPNKVIQVDDLLKDIGQASQKSSIRPIACIESTNANGKKSYTYKGQGDNFRKWFSQKYTENGQEKKGSGLIASVLNYRKDGAQVFEFNYHDEGYVEVRFSEGKKYAGQIDVISTIKMSGYRIMVENLTWIIPRSHSTGNHYGSKLYGTITNINQFSEWLMNNQNDKDFTANGEGHHWYRYYPIVNATGAHALQLETDEVFSIMTIAGETPPMLKGNETISIEECAKNERGYALHVYKDNVDDKTHTWDNNKYPPDNYKEGPAPEKPEGKYNIVKFYEQLINEDDDVRDKEAEFRHIVTYERTDTVPIIKIECETHEKIAPANYEVIEWKWSDQEKPDITPDLKWTDEPIASIPALDGRCGDKCTEDEPLDKQYIDITNIKEDGTKDTETVTTL